MHPQREWKGNGEITRPPNISADQPVSKHPPAGIYEHFDCGRDCRACDAELAQEGRPDEVRWDDDLM